MGGKSSNMQRTRESAKPVLRSLSSKVSIAFETVQVSNRRSASSSAADTGSRAMRILSPNYRQIVVRPRLVDSLTPASTDLLMPAKREDLSLRRTPLNQQANKKV